jgi:hypothetical protein
MKAIEQDLSCLQVFLVLEGYRAILLLLASLFCRADLRAIEVSRIFCLTT